MAPVVNTLGARQTLASMVAAALMATTPSLAPANLVTMATRVNTRADLVTMVTIVASNVSAQSMAVAILPLVTATADGVITGRTANKFASLGTLATTVPRDVSARTVRHVIL